MRVLPFAKWSGAHDIAKHFAGFTSDVLGDAIFREGAHGNAKGDLGAGDLDAAGAGKHCGFFPGRGKTLQSVRLGVETVDRFSGGGHAAAINEELAHVICDLLTRRGDFILASITYTTGLQRARLDILRVQRQSARAL